MKQKKGMTILEILVGMTIFSVVITLAVGAFVAVTRMKSLAENMRETQSKLRIANEMISRYAREGNDLLITDKKVTIVFNRTTNYTIYFRIDDGTNTLKYSECTGVNCTPPPTGEIDLLSGSVKLHTDSKFIKGGSFPPTLKYNLKGQVQGSSPYHSDNFVLDNEIILEGLR